MKIDEYLLKSAITAKKFPETYTLSKVHTKLLGDCFKDILDVSKGVDKLKKAIIYESNGATEDLASMFEYKDRDYLVGNKLQLSNIKMEALHAVLGLISESGELAEAIIAMISSDNPVDRINLEEELGDLLWYAAILFRSFNINPEEVMSLNIEKLKKRYPNQYSNAAALERADKYA